MLDPNQMFSHTPHTDSSDADIEHGHAQGPDYRRSEIDRSSGAVVAEKLHIGDNEGVAYKVKYLRVSPSVTKQVFEPLAQLKYGYF